MTMIKRTFLATALLFVFGSIGFSQIVQPVKKNQEYPLDAVRSNIIHFSPISAIDFAGGGPGLYYERIFSKDKRMSVILPFSFMIGNNNNNGDAYGMYFTPGVKFYPFGQRPVSYAVGPNFLLGYQFKNRYDLYTSHEDPNNPGFYISTNDQAKTTILRLGVLINNYVNFQITKNFNMGFAIGLGVDYIDKSKTTLMIQKTTQQSNGPIKFTGQVAYTLGFCF